MNVQKKTRRRLPKPGVVDFSDSRQSLYFHSTHHKATVERPRSSTLLCSVPGLSSVTWLPVCISPRRPDRPKQEIIRTQHWVNLNLPVSSVTILSSCSSRNGSSGRRHWSPRNRGANALWCGGGIPGWTFGLVLWMK